MSSDINQLQNGVNMVLRLFLRSPIIVFGSMIAAFLINTRAGTVFAVTIPVLAVVVFGIMLGTIPLYRKVQSLLDRVTGRDPRKPQRCPRCPRVQQGKEETEAFRRANEANTGMQNFVGKISALMNPLTYAILNLGVVVLMQVCSLEISNGTGLTDGDVLALYNYMGQILVELIKLANTIFTVTKAAAAVPVSPRCWTCRSAWKPCLRRARTLTKAGRVSVLTMRPSPTAARQRNHFRTLNSPPPRRYRRYHRRHRIRQNHAGQPDPPLLRRDTRSRLCGRAGCPYL